MGIKKIFVSILLFHLSYVLFGQSFGSKNTEWVYDYWGMGGSGITKFKVDGDTVVNGILYQRVSKTAIRDLDGEVQTFNRLPFYIRQKEGVVSYTGNFTFLDTLYNFDAGVGDSWSLPKRNSAGQKSEQSLIYTVLDTFQIDISDMPVLAQSVLIQVANNSSVSDGVIDTLFKDIGSRITLIVPFDWPPAGIEQGDKGVLRCFSNDELGVVDFLPYHLAGLFADGLGDFEYDCDELSSVSTGVHSTSISIYPNPGDGLVNIDYMGETLRRLQVYDLRGALLHSCQPNQSNYQLDVQPLNKGVYFLKVNDTITRKLVVVK